MGNRFRDIDIDWSSRGTYDDVRARIIKLHDEERFALAAELLPEFLMSHPDDGFAWFIFGDCLRMLGRPKVAKNALLKCLEIDPPKICWTAVTRLGMMSGNCGDFEQADHYYELALQNKVASDEVSWVWIFRGDNLRKLERFDEAVKCYEMAGKIEPNLAEVSVKLARIEVSRGSYSHARQLCNRALQLAPDDTDAAELLKWIDGA